VIIEKILQTFGATSLGPYGDQSVD